MDAKEALGAVAAGRALTRAEAESAMTSVMQGEATPAQLGALLAALAVRGETVEEIAGFAAAMRAAAVPVAIANGAIDTCGTGGDRSGTFNISTVATRYHSLMVDAATLPPEIEVSARSDDGVVMAIRHRTLPLEAVQFHPESVLSADGVAMLRNFIEGIK